MAKLELRTARGRWRIVAEHEELLPPVVELLAEREQVSAVRDEIVEFPNRIGRRARFRCAVIAGAERIASTLAAARISREHANLVWLRDRLFQVPAPLANGVLTRGALPCFEFSLRDEIEDASLWSRFRTSSPSDGRSVECGERARVLEELARELARMHALRFVHGELSPAHVLVGPTEAPSRIHFLPSFRGGARLTSRGAWRDLVRFVERAENDLTADDVRAFFAVYAEERRAQGRAVDDRTLAGMIAAHARADSSRA